MARKQNFQTIAWYWDLHQRDRLDLDPPYQRRSVWNQNYKDYFIDTILLGYPAPAIFLYEEIEPNGLTMYHVVDGKQRLTTLFEFVEDRFPVSEKAQAVELRESYFSTLDDEVKRSFWGYQFSVEYVSTTDQAMINNIFDRINRNTVKLSPQELRHARFSGDFIQAAEEFSEYMTRELGDTFPNIATKSRRQMKDVEFVSTLFLLLELGARGFSTADLDEAFSDRDEKWEKQRDVQSRFRRVIAFLKQLVDMEDRHQILGTRLRNQADFYSLFGAIDSLLVEKTKIDPNEAARRLIDFVGQVESDELRLDDAGLQMYYEAARSASNDTGPRNTRINIVRRVLTGKPLLEVVQ